MANHYLHQIVGDIILREFGEKVKRDFACCRDMDVREQLPLFSSKIKSRETQLCKVDMLIISENEVKVIIEIEESGMIPTKICGKFLTSGLAKYYIHYKEKEVPLANPLSFIQVLNSEKIPGKSSIQSQWVNIGKALQRLGEVDGRKLFYKLIFGEPKNFEKERGEELTGSIKKFLETGEV